MGRYFYVRKEFTVTIFLSEERKKPLEFETRVDTTTLDKALEKAEKLVELLKKAQELSANLTQSTE